MNPIPLFPLSQEGGLSTLVFLGGENRPKTPANDCREGKIWILLKIILYYLPLTVG